MSRSMSPGKISPKHSGAKQRCDTSFKETAFSRRISVLCEDCIPSHELTNFLNYSFTDFRAFRRAGAATDSFSTSGFNATQTIPAIVQEASFEHVRHWDVVDPGNTETGDSTAGWFWFYVYPGNWTFLPPVPTKYSILWSMEHYFSCPYFEYLTCRHRIRYKRHPTSRLAPGFCRSFALNPIERSISPGVIRARALCRTLESWK